MESFRISQMQEKLTVSFQVKSFCLTGVPPYGLKYFYFQTLWINDQCCWSNLWVLNKKMHRLSSTGVKTCRGGARLPLHELDVHSSCVLSFLWWPVKQKVKLQHMTSAKQHPNPQMLLWLISEKAMNKTCEWGNSQCIMDKGWTYSWLVHIHICVLEPSSYKDSSQIHLFACFRVLSDKSYMEVWQSGHLWGKVLHFSELL